MTERFLSLLIMVVLGAAARRWYGLPARALTSITLDILMPPFIFLAILDAQIHRDGLVHPAGAAAWVILGTVGIVLAAGRGRCGYRRFAMPIAFMNSGFLAFPVVTALGGAAWLNPALVYDQVMNLIIFTVGLWLMDAGESAGAHIRMFLFNPVLISIAAAVVWRLFDIPLPDAVRSILALPGQATIPMALFSVGAALSEMKFGHVRGIAAATTARFALGAALAVSYCAFFGLEGPVAQVIILSSTMPSAVLSFLLPERYGVEPDFAAGTVFLSSIVYPFLFPLFVALARLFA